MNSNKELSLYAVKAPDGYFESKMLALSEPLVELVKNDKAWYYYISAPLKKDKLLECYYYPNRLDSSQGILRFHSIMSQRAKTKGFLPPFISGQWVEFMGEYGEYITEHIMFLKKDPNKFTNLKSAAVSRRGDTFLCAVSFPKMNKSLNQIMQSFIEHIDVPKPALPLQKADFKQVFSLSFGKDPFGWTEVYMYPDPKTRLRKIVSITTSLGPGNPLHYLGHDWVTSELVDNQGNIINGQYIHVRNGVTNYFLALQKTKNNHYQLQGQFYNESLFKELDVPEGLKSHYYAQDMIDEKSQEFISDPRKDIRFNQYIPHLSPITPIEATLSYTGKDEKKGHRFSTTIENLGVDFYFREGSKREHLVESKLHGNTLTQELIYETGDR